MASTQSRPALHRADRTRRPDRMRREPLVPSGVLGMLIFVVTEVMFFAGLISAYMIAEGVSTGGWPPPGQPRLPVEETAVNSGALILSGLLLIASARYFKRNERRSRRLMLFSIVLGSAFVLFQGVEWLALIREGLTLTYSTHGSFFYLIVGLHALHAIAAILGLGWVYGKWRRGTMRSSQYWTAQVFWYFVVGLWPVLYYQVYL